MEYNDNSSGPENFVPNDASHSGNTEQPNEGMCRVDKFEVIKYSIGNNKEFLGIRTLERDSWAQTINGIPSIYLDIFYKKDEGWTCAGDVVDFGPGISLETSMMSTMDFDGVTCLTGRFLGLNQKAYMS
ncbi:hypothetical protein Tco_1337416 [Tanacetum coccineum]